MICLECRIGRMQARYIPYLHRYGRHHILLAPNVPSLVCDVCGQTDYDPVYMDTLQRLIDLQATKPGASNRIRPSSLTDPQDWPPARRSG